MFKTRLISGVILLIVAILSLGLGGIFLTGVLLLISLEGFLELCNALGTKAETKAESQVGTKAETKAETNAGTKVESKVETKAESKAETKAGTKVESKVETKERKKGKLGIPVRIGIIGVVFYYIFMFLFPTNETLLISIILVFLAEMFAYVFCFPGITGEEVIQAVFSFLYAPVMLSFAFMTRNSEVGQYMVWLILISSWGCDTCAYCVGKLIGKKKVFPVLSPHKSLEGCIGGCVGSALIGMLYGFLVVERELPDQNIALILAIICAMGALMSMVGDLAASAIKRQHHIKDYANLIPGHGGVMDRFDSMIVTAPMVYILTMWMIQM